MTRGRGRSPSAPAAAGVFNLYWMNADGTGKKRVTFAPGFDGLPVFSSDGAYLMWSSKRTGDNTTQVFAGRFRAPK